MYPFIGDLHFIGENRLNIIVYNTQARAEAVGRRQLFHSFPPSPYRIFSRAAARTAAKGTRVVVGGCRARLARTKGRRCPAQRSPYPYHPEITGRNVYSAVKKKKTFEQKTPLELFKTLVERYFSQTYFSVVLKLLFGSILKYFSSE